MTREEENIRPAVLVVDDQPKNLMASSAILEPLGLDIVRASSGAEALRRVLEREFAAILLDVQMPDMDGFETASLIRKREKSRHIPILFLTAINKEARYVARGYELGAVDYLFKPFEPEVLRSKVMVFVELFRKNEVIRHQAEIIKKAKERELAELRRASDQRYMNLAEAMPQMVWVADASGTIRYSNGRLQSCAGLAPDDPPPQWSQLLHGADLGPFLARWGAALKAKESWEAEFRFGNARKNDYRWHLVRAVAVTSHDGAISWIGTSTDIHDRKRAEEGIRLVAEASRVLASITNVEEALAEVAKMSLPRLGDACAITLRGEENEPRLVASSALTREMHDALADPRFALGAANVLLTGERELALATEQDGVVDLNARFLRDLGVRSYICVPITGRDGVLGAVAFAAAAARADGDDDVTLAEDLARRAAAAVDNARLHAMAENERKLLEEANRAKDVFLATLSHELRTPLNAIMGWTQIMRSGALDEEKLKRAINTIERNARAQAQLVADLLDVSRIVTGKLKLEPVPVDLPSIVEGVVEASRPAAEAKKITLESMIDPAAAEVMGDPVRLQQVVSNLLSNAIKFTPAGGRVTVVLERAERRALVRVKDSGQGIGADFLPYVFDRFRQADHATTRAQGGLGLGLAIVKHFVELHGGTVAAFSEGAGQGAELVVELPLVSSVMAGVASQDEERISDVGADVLHGLDVVVVEDDPDGRELVEMLLSEYGARVRACASVGDALETIRARLPDVVVSDIGMPGEDGLALIRKLRALPADRGGHLPAIALTAYASREDTARVLGAGFDAHVAKPVDPTEFGATVARLVGRSSRAPHHGAATA
jgi:PAS domain S-box-containing protein